MVPEHNLKQVFSLLTGKLELTLQTVVSLKVNLNSSFCYIFGLDVILVGNKVGVK